MDIKALLQELGLDPAALGDGDMEVRSPVDGARIARVASDTPQAVGEKIARAEAAFLAWRTVPPPRRGELIRLFGDELRANKDALGRLVTVESGKILQEGLGEVQEMIDICDFAVGLSRQLYGLTIASERPGHRMMETWHPLGPIGVISAFNFPVAVWAWNAALAIVCGGPVLWKPSERRRSARWRAGSCSKTPWPASAMRRTACRRSSSAAATWGRRWWMMPA